MKLNAVGVSSKDLTKTVIFYKLLGFSFPEFNDDEVHLESITKEGSAKLMIDAEKLMTDLIGEIPKPANHSNFAIEYETPEEVNDIAKKVKESGFKIVKEPWDAFWGQRYCVLEDPDSYKIDLYSIL